MNAVFPSAPDTLALERGAVLAPRFDANGLIAALATHAHTGEVLMFAWMNAEALARTLETGEAHYYSRSRQALWKKGETSGQVQAVEEVRVDCDQDAVLHHPVEARAKADMTGAGRRRTARPRPGRCPA